MIICFSVTWLVGNGYLRRGNLKGTNIIGIIGVGNLGGGKQVSEGGGNLKGKS